VPDLGRVEGDVLLVSWLVKEGDEVVKGQEVVELETSKVTFSVESDIEGKISKMKKEGTKVLVGEMIAFIS
tara:strand:+ start:1784 stop:1996 length:213 start_codon:yes stop_codon:yes gene_type:complete